MVYLHGVKHISLIYLAKKLYQHFIPQVLKVMEQTMLSTNMRHS